MLSVEAAHPTLTQGCPLIVVRPVSTMDGADGRACSSVSVLTVNVLGADLTLTARFVRVS